MTTTRLAQLIAMVLALGLAWPAKADDTVYKCGNGSYSSAPCAGGVKIDAADPRAAAQRRQAQDAVRRDADLGDKLAAQRRADEHAAMQQRAGSMSHAASAPHKAATAPGKGHGNGHGKKKHGGKQALPDDPNLSAPMRGASAPGKKR